MIFFLSLVAWRLYRYHSENEPAASDENVSPVDVPVLQTIEAEQVVVEFVSTEGVVVLNLGVHLKNVLD